MKPLFFILALIAYVFSISSYSQGIEGVYEVIIRKQEEKKNNRWSLADWLVTKQKIALMDQWLALHSSSTWFEMFLEGTSGELDGFNSNAAAISKASSSRFQTAVYLRAIGLQYGIEKFPGFFDTKVLQGNLILLGTSAQSTNIQVHYGQRTMEASFGEFKPSFWGASGTLYLLSFLGGSYEYRKLSKKGAYLGGDRLEYGGFVDVFFLRLKATYFKERGSFNRSFGDFGQHLSGWWFGGQLYF